MDAGQFVFTSVLICKHDRQHSVDDRFSIFALDSWLLIQIDFPEELSIAQLEAAEVVLTVGIVVWVGGGWCEVVITYHNLTTFRGIARSAHSPR